MRLPTLPIPEDEQLTEEKLPELLLALGERPVLLDACEKVGVHIMALRLAMKEDNELATQIDWAMSVGFEVVEQRIASRALGERKPRVDSKGRIISAIDPQTGETIIAYDETHSDQLLKKFAERHRPDLYGDRVDVNHGVQPTVYMPADMLAEEFDKMLADQSEKTDRILANGGEDVIDAEYEEVDPGAVDELV